LKRILFILIFSLLLAGMIIGYSVYKDYLGPNVPRGLADYHVEIPTGSTFEQVQAILHRKGLLVDTSSFRSVSERLKYIRQPMRAGRFRIEPGRNNLTLVRHLRGGKQAPVDLILTTNERLPENVAAKAARFIEPDSLQLLTFFTDTAYLSSIGYTLETLPSLFIPNTYEFFWNTSPSGFMERMIKEHDRFWEKNDRLKKAEQLGLSPEEVYTLASIVEKETNRNEEKRRMAGVYLNRLEIGMRLQADPTAVFATRDFETKRVLNYHLEFDSPYNTYIYAGLPPGPIAMASIASIDAVLNPEEHDYFYFVAKGDGSGLHMFAKNLRGHNQNIRIYQRNLRERGLR
jgi:UPF0755 protein